ncbi:mitochondrial ATP-independent inner membrane protease subunit 1a isoform X2 [Castanea sativa]|uniref:mitochondrial ATP-independent inner membrane protease subunit 1a isoform X2 n=1 Tax=Castanea sativa TaxID=21020 RepID=UPI003F64A5FD
MRLLSYMGQWKSAAKEVLDRTAIVAKFLCLLHVTNNYLCSPTLVGNPINTCSIFLFSFCLFVGWLGLLSCGVQVYGPSMLPTLNLTGDVVLAEHVSHKIGKVGTGDVVLVRSPVDPRRILTKRVVGMEGDTVSFYVDPMYSQTTVVPKGHVWIQGDNTYASSDSRHFGPVPYGLIQGKVFFRVWPPDGFGTLEQ